MFVVLVFILLAEMITDTDTAIKMALLEDDVSFPVCFKNYHEKYPICVAECSKVKACASPNRRDAPQSASHQSPPSLINVFFFLLLHLNV